MPEVVGTLSDGAHNGGGLNGQDAYTGRIIPVKSQTPIPIAFQQNTRDEVRLMGGHGQIVGALAAEAGMKQQNYVAFHPTQDPISHDDGTTHAMGTGSGQGYSTVAVAFEPRVARNGRGAPSDVVPPLKAQSGQTGKGDAAPCVATSMQVRLLTPTECERLQGFPDSHTLIPWRGKDASDCPDGPRYKALGNSMAIPVVSWIGKRIWDEVERRTA